MKSSFEWAGVTTLAFLIAASPAMSQEGWPRCGREDDCPSFYLSVTTKRGDARLSVSRDCAGAWRHVWRKRDARETIRQWLDHSAAGAAGTLCIPLHPDVDEIRVSSIGGHCGETDFPEIASANAPGAGAVLARGYGRAASARFEGCHARIGPDAGEGGVAYGGVALDFADGYVFGDSYADGYFYGVYDGFGRGRVRPFGVAVAAISQFNTYHYRVEILMNGRNRWTWGDKEGDD
ncbi:MAG: hypothetical protein QNJ84_03440 [Alphaproteobacteria bacterium]|nr:hypothetical protein [Alphaproteobacteria bacterium]